MTSKVTLPLHRFIKKFLKIFQAHGNSIVSPLPPPPTPVPQKSKQMDVEANIASRRLVAIQKKVRDDLHDSAVQ